MDVDVLGKTLFYLPQANAKRFLDSEPLRVLIIFYYNPYQFHFE